MVAWCAYCQSFIAVREPLDDPAVTHGACDACVDRVLREWRVLTEVPTTAPIGFAGRGTGHRLDQAPAGAGQGGD